jgi:hypothetical protein
VEENLSKKKSAHEKKAFEKEAKITFMGVITPETYRRYTRD